ncbi:MAG: transposase [Chitinophagales bacterium]
MARRKIREKRNTTYFITFTCLRWLPLIRETNLYDEIYRWFDIMKKDGSEILGYVIMPNHIHFLIYYCNEKQNLNKTLANGKRFLAYEIIKRLKGQNRQDFLEVLKVREGEPEYGKGSKHRVFIPTFDSKECWDTRILEQKLNYIHRNPLKGVWHLADHPTAYVHSSAGFYASGRQGVYPVKHYLEIYHVPVHWRFR